MSPHPSPGVDSVPPEIDFPPPESLAKSITIKLLMLGSWYNACNMTNTMVTRFSQYYDR